MIVATRRNFDERYKMPTRRTVSLVDSVRLQDCEIGYVLCCSISFRTYGHLSQIPKQYQIDQ